MKHNSYRFYRKIDYDDLLLYFLDDKPICEKFHGTIESMSTLHEVQCTILEILEDNKLSDINPDMPFWGFK